MEYDNTNTGAVFQPNNEELSGTGTLNDDGKENRICIVKEQQKDGKDVRDEEHDGDADEEADEAVGQALRDHPPCEHQPEPLLFARPARGEQTTLQSIALACREPRHLAELSAEGLASGFGVCDFDVARLRELEGKLQGSRSEHGSPPAA